MVQVIDQNSTALLPPNWSQFLPDVIVALMTGLVIGFALYYVQRSAFIRDQRQDAQRSWDRLQSSLRNWFDVDYEPGNWLETARLQGILATVDDRPIQDWARLLKTDHTLKALVRLEHNSHRLMLRAEKLDGVLEKVLPEVRPDQVPKTMAGYKEALAAARALAQGRHGSGPRSEDYGDDSARLLQKWAQDALADSRVRSLLAEFRLARGATLRDYRTIAQAFKRADMVTK